MVKLSVIIPYYKTYDLTVKLLDKLCPQLTDEVEVFLIDDGCHEDRLDVYKDKIIIEHLEKNQGSSIGMNIAIKKSIGTYIAIIDSDDMITDDYIETLIHYIDTINDDVILFNWQDMHTKEIVRHPSNYAPWKAIYKRSIMPLFREHWIYSYDVPFQQDLDKTNYTRYYIDKVLYIYNSNREGSLTLMKEEIRRKQMIKVEVVKPFTLEKINELKNIKRVIERNDNLLNPGDTFECTSEMYDYLYKDNIRHESFVKLIEVMPEVKPVEKPIEKKPIKKIIKNKK